MKSVSSVVRNGTHKGPTAINRKPRTRRALVKKIPAATHRLAPIKSEGAFLLLMRVRRAAMIAARTMTVITPRISTGWGDGVGVRGDMRG